MYRPVLVFVALLVKTSSFGVSAEPDDLDRAVLTARALRRQGRIREAEKQCLIALDRMDSSGTSKQKHMTLLAELALVYVAEGRFPEAQQNYKYALSLAEAASISANEMDALLGNMAQAYRSHGRYDEAIRVLRRCLEIERQQGNESWVKPFTLAMLASVYFDQRRYPEAERLFREAVDLMRISLGPGDQETAVALNDLGEALRAQHKFASADEVLQEAIAIKRRISPDHPGLATTLSNLAGLRTDQGRYGEAESLLGEAAVMQQNALGSAERTERNE
jgi:tetratricopeptide (TPR) repeat protein